MKLIGLNNEKMIFNTYNLKKGLNSYIESMFHFKEFMPEHSIERVVPTGHVFIIFELDGITRYTFDNKTLKRNKSFSKVWVSGVHKNYLSISAHNHSEMFVIQFKPGGAYSYFKQPINQITNQVIAAEEIFGQQILDLRRKLLKLYTAEEKFKAAENWLCSLFSKDKTPPEELLDFITSIHHNPTHKLSKMMSDYTKSQKHLIHQFKKYVGVTPKYYQRIVRFNEILQQLHQSKQVDWAQLAYQLDYTDQSHLIKEFKHFSGFNPEKFINKDYHKEEPNFFPIEDSVD